MSALHVGAVFGKLTITQFYRDVRQCGRTKRMAVCKCECGSFVNVEKYNLSSGNTKQCGDCASLSRGKQARKHGHSWSASEKGSLESKCYYTWQAMKRRCFNESESHYDRYGGRGITVCTQWIDSYECFLNDMGLPPSRDHQIDRIDNDGDYTPKNCHWVDRMKNARNKGNNRMISAFGKTQSLSEWEEELGIKRETIARRLNKGEEPESALSTKMRKPGKVRKVSTPDGEFDTLSDAARAAGMSVSGAHSRMQSVKYPQWRYI